MTNRAEQTWPEEMTYDVAICNPDGDDCVLGSDHRLRDVILSPYAHELNGAGTHCAVDCAACQWVKFNGEVR